MSNSIMNQLNKTSTEASEYIPAASHYALKLAFHSLKERCEKLQDRVCSIEEENSKLKENQGNVSRNATSYAKVEFLINKVEELNRQKSQLSHHIFMLANENRELWDSISKLNEDKQVLVEQLRDLNAKLTRFEVQEEKPISSDHALGGTELNRVFSRSNESFTDVSSKEDIKVLTEAPVTGVNDPAKEVVTKQLPTDELNSELKAILGKLNEEKQLLQQHQLSLRNALGRMQKIYRGIIIYAKYLKRLKLDNESPSCSSDQFKEEMTFFGESLPSLQESVNAENDEIICPFCGKLFVKNSLSQDPNESFINHVKECSVNDLSLISFEVIV